MSAGREKNPQSGSKTPALTTPVTIKLTAIVLFIAATFLFITWIPDDSYISFRYADNLAAGRGLVFNDGEKVEGFSNLLWTLALGAAARAGADTVQAAVFLSLLCAAASVWIAFGLFDAALAAAQHGGRRWLKTAFGLGLIASFPMIFYATSGLETHAEVLLLLLGTTLHLRGVQTPAARWFVVSTLAFLAVALIRPEGISFLLVNAAFIAYRYRATRQRVLIGAAAGSFLIYVLVAVLKMGYYHSLIPNTYLAKPGLSFSYLVPLQRGVYYLIRFFTVSGLALMLPFWIVAVFKSKARYAVAYLSVLVLTQLAFILFVGGDVLRFDRFTVPLMPFLMTVALLGFAEIRRERLATTAAWVCVAVMVVLNGERIHRALGKPCYHDWMHARAHKQIGFLLADLLPPQSSVVVNEIGAISYYSGFKSIDMIGLTEATVGRLIYESYQRFGVSGSEWSSPRIADHLLSLRPTCVVVPAYGEVEPSAAPAVDLMHPIWAAVYQHDDLKKLYRRVFSARISDSKLLYFFVLNGVDLDKSRLERFPDVDCLNIHPY